MTPETKKRSKLGVDIDLRLKKRLDIEAARSGMTLRDLVDLRLRHSYGVASRIPAADSTVTPHTA